MSLAMIELFCGRGEITQAFAINGFQTWKTDKRKRKGVCEPDLRIDFNQLYEDTKSGIIHYPFKKVHVVWAGVPCTAFSYGAGDYYFKNDRFKVNADQYIELLKNCLDLIRIISPDFYFIENPRGHMRHHKELHKFLLDTGGVIKTITLSSYGFSNTKPTNIFTNGFDWMPRQLDDYGRGAKVERPLNNLTISKRQSTPYELGNEIAQYCISKISTGLPPTGQLMLFNPDGEILASLGRI